MKFKLLFFIYLASIATINAQDIEGVTNDSKQVAIDSLRIINNAIEAYIADEIQFSGGEKILLQTAYANKPNFIWCNEAERNEGPIANLVDGDVGTYFHSCYSSIIEPIHWLQVNLEEPLSKFNFSYHTRSNVNSDFPQAIEVSGSNDGAQFTFIKKFEKGLPQTSNTSWVSELVESEQSYSYLRFTVTAPKVYFHMAEFSLKTETIIPDKYLPFIEYLQTLRDLNNQAKSMYEDSENTEIDEIIALTEKLRAFYNIRESIFNGSITDWGFDGNILWVLEDYKLSISGTGAMPYYNSGSKYPWYVHQEDINEVIINNSITSIGQYAFYNYNNIRDITLGSSLNSIDNYAFSDLTDINITTKAVIPPSIGVNTFYNTSGVIVNVPEGCSEVYASTDKWKNYFIIEGNGVSVTVALNEAGTLGDLILAQVENFADVNTLVISGPINSDDIYNFRYRLTGLVNLDISQVAVTQLNKEAFKQMQNLQSIVLPKTLDCISESMFEDCSMLKEVNIPTSVTSIGNYAFQNCRSLRKIEIHEGTTNIGRQAFKGCHSLMSVKLPSTLEKIEDYTFQGNSQLKKVTIAEGIKYIGEYAFIDCRIDSLKLPSTIHHIGYCAFQNNKELKHIEFNEGLYWIERYAFQSCSALEELTLPSTLVLAHGNPFYNCDNIKKVTCHSIEPPYINSKIRNNLNGCELYVPEISLNVYKQTEYWDDFPIIKPIDHLPQNINIMGNHKLTLPEELPINYKPSIVLICNREGKESYGALTVNGSNSLNISSLSSTWDYYYYSNNKPLHASLINNATLRADSIEINMHIQNRTWVFFSLPFDVKVSNIEVVSEGSTSFVIRRYDGEKRAIGENDATWVRISEDDILKAGEGYILQASRYVDNNYVDDCNLRFKSIDNANKNNILLNDNAIIELNEHQSEFIHNQGWNLIGNPYPCYYDTRYMGFTAPITVWNIKDKTYSAYSPIDDSYILLPGEAFFVQCPSYNKIITFDKEGRQNNITARDISTSTRAKRENKSVVRNVINLTISDGKNVDKTRIVLNGNAKIEYESDKDAGKFMSNDTSVPQIYTTENGIDYAINERPINTGIVQIGTRFSIDGTYTIALTKVPEEYYVFLLDKMNGNKILLSNEEYSFTAKAGVDTARFSLIFSAKETTGIYDINTGNNIDSNIYNLNGVKVSKPTQKGIYIQNGKKIIIK